MLPMWQCCANLGRNAFPPSAEPIGIAPEPRLQKPSRVVHLLVPVFQPHTTRQATKGPKGVRVRPNGYHQNPANAQLFHSTSLLPGVSFAALGKTQCNGRPSLNCRTDNRHASNQALRSFLLTKPKKTSLKGSAALLSLHLAGGPAHENHEPF